MNEKDIRALVRLAQDSNPELAEQAADELVDLGMAALAALQELADERPALAARLTQRIEARLLEEEWADLAMEPDGEQAALLLARWQDPLLDPAEITGQLDSLAAALRGAIPSAPTAVGYRRDATALRDLLAGARQFRGNAENYYAPENSLLPHVLESRRGIPLTLSMVYLFVARRLEAPLYPIGMPQHFILRYGSEEEGIYIDPFHQGALMTREDCKRLLAQQHLNWRPAYLRPISEHAMVERLLRNLINAYAMQQNEPAVTQLVKYFEIWTDRHAGQS